MNRRLPVLIVVLLISVTLTGAPAQAATLDVAVRDNEFSPKVMQIQPGDTVRWTCGAGCTQHSVTEDVPEDRRFNHPVEFGQSVAWTAGQTEELVRYRCTLHGGMEGLIRIGDPPGAPVPAVPEVVVPDDVPTIADAAKGAQPGTVVLVRPGVYQEEVVVSVPDLTIRGLGEDPEEVVLDGAYRRAVGVSVDAPGVRIDNLTVRAYRHTGIRVHDTTATVLSDVVLDNNDLYGVDVLAASGVGLTRVSATRHGIAGIALRDCPACGARIDDARLERNAAGLLADGATGLLVRHSDISGNAVGIVLRDTSGATVTANTLAGNAATDVRVASPLSGSELPTGAGIWLIGGQANRITGNALSSHTYNIAVTGPAVALDHRITGNHLGEAAHADLGIDAVGTGICLAGNRGLDGAEPSTHPTLAPTLYDCGLPTTIGILYPLVTTHLLMHALSDTP